MRILLFGGTFDPPHRGHMDLLKNAIAAAEPDRVFVVPAGVPPHKQASATPPWLRMEMCACFKPLFPGLVISDVEINRGGKSYTYDTVLHFKGHFPAAEIYLCVGSDMLLSFTEWHRWKELLGQVTLVTQARDEGDRAPLAACMEKLAAAGARIMFSERIEEVSSTEIRQAIAAGRDVSGLIPPPADDIIQRNGLYRI